MHLRLRKCEKLPQTCRFAVAELSLNFRCPALIDIDHTKQLLVSFVANAAKIYGKQILVYNMHNILHIVDDVKMHGRLDNVSCFPYENALGQLKRLVKKPQHPIAQIVRCLHEQGQQQEPQNTKFSLHIQYYSGPIIFKHSHWPTQCCAQNVEAGFMANVQK